ncbi:MAG: hypothetical protein KJ606_13105 [Chloroflexi bacterium]|nr:hypothetical protein [Chloroflexota bacterium]
MRWIIKKRYYFRGPWNLEGTQHVVRRIIAKDYGEALDLIRKMVAQEKSRGGWIDEADFEFLKEEPEDRELYFITDYPAIDWHWPPVSVLRNEH